MLRISKGLYIENLRWQAMLRLLWGMQLWTCILLLFDDYMWVHPLSRPGFCQFCFLSSLRGLWALYIVALISNIFIHTLMLIPLVGDFIVLFMLHFLYLVWRIKAAYHHHSAFLMVISFTYIFLISFLLQFFWSSVLLHILFFIVIAFLF